MLFERSRGCALTDCGVRTCFQRFVLDPSYGEFIYVGPMNVPSNGGKQIYSVNEGNYNVWDDNIKDAIDEFKVRLAPCCLRLAP